MLLRIGECADHGSLPDTGLFQRFKSLSSTLLMLPWPTLKVLGVQLHPNVFSVYLTQFFSSGSLPTRQVQMFDVAIPLVVELVLSAFYILPPSSSPASFVLVFLLIFFL